MNQDIIRSLEEATSKDRPGVLCTVVDKNGSTPCQVGSKMWVEQDGKIIGTVGGGDMERETINRALDMLKRGIRHDLMKYSLVPKDDEKIQSGLICGGQTSIFMEMIGKKRELLIFGAGHVGKSVGQIARFCGYCVTFWDDRDNVDISSVGGAKLLDCDLKEMLTQYKVESGTYIVVCTWGHLKDSEVVELLEDSEPSYIGMLSSRKKSETLWKRLIDQGVSKDYLNKIHTPIGLEIGAGSPQEIAISIMAQIISIDSGQSHGGRCPSEL